MLVSVDIPEGVTTIGPTSFGGCHGLISVTISNGLASIGEDAFSACAALTSFNVSAENEKFSSSDGVLFNKAKTELLFYPAGKAGSYTIPDGVTTIGRSAFLNCRGLTSVTIPDSVTAIDSYAFNYCIALPRVILPKNVETIDEYAFAGCFGLTSVVLSERIATIDEGAFNDCGALKDVWYTEPQEQHQKISISTGNTPLTSATWHFESCPVGAPHTYDNGCDAYCNGCQKERTPSHIYDDFCDEECNACKGMRAAPHTYNRVCDTACSVCKELRVPPHAYSAVCDTVCDICRATREAAPHTYDNDCDTECNLCRETRTITHRYFTMHLADEDEHWLECAVCGSKKEIGEHTYSNSCDKDCNICGATRIVSHKYSAATCTKAKTCSVCGVTSGSALGHSYKAATCTKAKTCTVCGATSGSKLGHSYKAATCTKAKTCTRCSITSGSKLGHSYTNACDKTCNRCSATRTIAHTYKKVITKATLTKNGKIQNKCSVCGYISSKVTAIRRASSFKLSTTTYTYNGKAKTPSVTVKDTAGKVLKKGTDYVVTYSSGRKNVGTYKVKITFKGKYSGSRTLIFKINPAKTTVSKLTAGTKKLTVSITKKKTQVSGYQLQYSTSRKFTSAKTKTTTATKLTLKGLKAKKTYYVRVRTYKMVGGVKYYSGWSTYKYKKTK